MQTHLRREGTLTAKLSSGDGATLTIFKMLAPAQLEQGRSCPHTLPLLLEPCSLRWLGIYAPLCQPALMDYFQDGRRVSGIHLPDVSTFSSDSLLMLAAICLHLTIRPGLLAPSVGLPASKGLQGLPLQGPEDPPPGPVPQTPSIPLDKPSCKVI